MMPPFHPTTSGRTSPPFWPWPGPAAGPPKAGLTGQYDAAKGITFSVGLAVSGWADQSGNGRHLTGSTTLIPSGVINGLPGVDFTGSAAMSYEGPLGSGVALNGPRTIGAVLKPTSASGGGVISIRRAEVAVRGNFTADLLTVGNQYVQTNQNFTDITTTPVVNYNGVALAYICQWDGTANPASLRVTINGNLLTTSSATPGGIDPTTTDGILFSVQGSQPRDLIFCEAEVYAASGLGLHDALLGYYRKKFNLP